MSKVNPLSKSGDDSRMIDTKLAGGKGAKAARQDEIALLRRLTLANLLWENNAYVDGVEVAKQISELIPLCNPQKVAELARECRLVQKLRHTPLFICVEMLKHKPHSTYVKEILPDIITRADMITDFLAIYEKSNGSLKPLANAAKKGLAEAFKNFDEYGFAKYDRNANIKIRDAMFLCKPKPADKAREELYRNIANRTLKVPDTWEVALSTGKDKKETWTRLVKESKLGGLAMLRNIRNMKEAKVDKDIIAEGLKNLKGALLLPMNFLQAATINPEFSRDIEDAMIRAYKDIKKLPGKTLVVVDISGSMDHSASLKGTYNRLEMACAMAMFAGHQCESYELVATAGSGRNPAGKEGHHVHIRYPEKGFGIVKQISDCRKITGGWGIFTRQCLEWCWNYVGKEFTRIIVISDSQDQDPRNKVPTLYGDNNYIIDVSAHRNGINYKGIWSAEITGCSEHFLTYIASLEGIENVFEDLE